MAISGCPRAELKGSEEILAFKVGVIIEDLVDRHAAGEQFEEALHRIAQAADCRLPVAHGRVNGDPIET